MSGRQPKRGRGRPKGSTNFFTRDMKEAIIDACNELGFDGQGQEGMKGYMKFLGKNFPPVFGGLMRAVLPTQVSVEQVQRPKRYQTMEEVLEELKAYGIVPMEQKALPRYIGPEIELDSDDVNGEDEAAG